MQLKLLLDTHLLLWAAEGEGLPMEAASLIEDDANQLVFSAASIWEVAIKSSLGRSDFRVDPLRLHRALIANQYEELPVSGEHASAVARLPSVHRDPFDRLLVAQALTAGLTLLTADARLSQYPGLIRIV